MTKWHFVGLGRMWNRDWWAVFKDVENKVPTRHLGRLSGKALKAKGQVLRTGAWRVVCRGRSGSENRQGSHSPLGTSNLK